MEQTGNAISVVEIMERASLIDKQDYCLAHSGTTRR